MRKGWVFLSVFGIAIGVAINAAYVLQICGAGDFTGPAVVLVLGLGTAIARRVARIDWPWRG